MLPYHCDAHCSTFDRWQISPCMPFCLLWILCPQPVSKSSSISLHAPWRTQPCFQGHLRGHYLMKTRPGSEDRGHGRDVCRGVREPIRDRRSFTADTRQNAHALVLEEPLGVGRLQMSGVGCPVLLHKLRNQQRNSPSRGSQSDALLAHAPNRQRHAMPSLRHHSHASYSTSAFLLQKRTTYHQTGEDYRRYTHTADDLGKALSGDLTSSVYFELNPYVGNTGLRFP